MGQGVPPGRYPIFKVVTQPGTNPLDFRNWIGGLGGLRSINFIIGLSDDESLDFDNDGFPDDDLNRDGFHDDEATLDRLARVKEKSGETGDDDQNQNELDDDNQDDENLRSRTRTSRRGESL
tara:strand:+ start:848 stop:1213 length:366 start_codon:yes stop_codon:yes gene_type:complete